MEQRGRQPVRQMFEALDPLPRSALELAHGSGMSVAEIARSLERPPGEVRAALREGLLALARSSPQPARSP